MFRFDYKQARNFPTALNSFRLDGHLSTSSYVKILLKTAFRFTLATREPRERQMTSEKWENVNSRLFHNLT